MYLSTQGHAQLLSCVQLFEIPWTTTCQAPLSMGFSRKEYWGGLPFPSPEDVPTQGSNSRLLHWLADSLPLSYLGGLCVFDTQGLIKLIILQLHLELNWLFKKLYVMLPAFVLKRLYQPLLLDHQCKCQQSVKERWSAGVLIKIAPVWDIPGGPVVESIFQCRECGSHPCSRNEDPPWQGLLISLWQMESPGSTTRDAPMCLSEDRAQPKIIIKNKHKIKTQSYLKKKIVLVFWIPSVRISGSPKAQITPWQPGLWTSILPPSLYLHPSCLDRGGLCWRQRPP